MNRTNTKLPGFSCCSPRSLTNLGVGSWWFMNLEAAWEQMTLFNLQLKNWVPTVSLLPARRSTPCCAVHGDVWRLPTRCLQSWGPWPLDYVIVSESSPPANRNWQLVISGFNVADQAWSWAQREREIDRLKGLKYNWMNGERDIGEMDKHIQNHIRLQIGTIIN